MQFPHSLARQPHSPFSSTFDHTLARHHWDWSASDPWLGNCVCAYVSLGTSDFGKVDIWTQRRRNEAEVIMADLISGKNKVAYDKGWDATAINSSLLCSPPPPPSRAGSRMLIEFCWQPHFRWEGGSGGGPFRGWWEDTSGVTDIKVAETSTTADMPGSILKNSLLDLLILQIRTVR